MKIAFVLDDTLDSSDGVQQYIRILGSWLKTKGHSIDYIVGASKPDNNVHSMAKNIKVRFNGNKLSIPLPANSKQIKDLLDKKQYDILHVQMPHSPFLANKCIALAPKHTAIVGTFHVAPYGKLAHTGAKLAGLTVKKELKKVTKIVAVSEVAADFAKKVFNRDCEVVSNAVEIKAWAPTKQVKQEHDIVFVGRLVKRKGCIYLLQAIKEIRSLQPNISLNVVIAGDGADRAKLEAFVNTHDLTSNVTFAGFVTEDYKKQLLQSSKLAVFPSTGGESFGIVLLEAMAAGALAIGGNNPGYASVLKNSEVLVDPHNTEDFSRKIIQYLGVDADYKKEHARQQQLVKQFDINQVGNAILELYIEAVQGNNDARQ